MPEANSAVPGFDVQSFNGLYWGIMVSTVLFGINIVQVWIYVNTNEDKWPLRSFVALLFGIDVAQTAICSKLVHHYFIENFGNPAVFAGINVSTNVEYALVVVIVFFVQLYFAGRVYKLHRNRVWIPVIIVIGAVGTFVSGILSINIIVKGASDISTLVSDHMRVAAGIDHGFATVTDIITTAALSWAVSTNRSGFRRTRALLQRLLLYIVTRGLLVTIVQVAFLIAYEAQPFGLSWAVLHFCLGKVYVVTMITMLNSRVSLRSEFGGPIDVTESALVDSNYMGSSIGVTSPHGIHLVKTDINTLGRSLGVSPKSNKLQDKNYAPSLTFGETAIH